MRCLLLSSLILLSACGTSVDPSRTAAGGPLQKTTITGVASKKTLAANGQRVSGVVVRQNGTEFTLRLVDSSFVLASQAPYVGFTVECEGILLANNNLFLDNIDDCIIPK